jgi:hypothetical protein
VLPTIAVILWAYGTYALVSFIFKRKGVHSRGRNHGRKFTGFTLLGGFIGLGFILWCSFCPEKTDQRLKLAGFLGTVYAEGWPNQVDRVEYPPVKAQNPGGEEQPAYALLHPETPTSQIEPEKKLLKPRPSRAVKKPQPSGLQDKSGKATKVAKTAVSSSKKDKMAAKNRAKKKKRSSATETRQTNAG